MRLFRWATLLAVFLLPWQTRWIFERRTLPSGEGWEYGQLSLYAVEILIMLALGLRMLAGRPTNQEPTRRFFHPWLLLLLPGLGLIRSADPTLTVASWGHLLFASGFIVLLLDARIRSPHLLKSFVSGLIPAVLLGWWQLLMGESPASSLFGLASHAAAVPGDAVVQLEDGFRLLRAYGPLPHPNIFGGFLAVGFLSLIALFHRRSWQDPFLAVGSLAVGSGLILTFSRSSWVALLVGVIVFVLLMLWERRTPPHTAIPAIVFLLCVTAATAILFFKPIVSRVNISLPLEANSLAERLGQWSAWDDVWYAAPWTGVGVGGYTLILAQAHPDSPSWAYQPIHNTFVLLVTEVGVIGMLVFGWVLFRYVYILWGHRAWSGGMFALSLMSLWFVLGMFDHYLWSLEPGLMLTGFVLAMGWRMAKQER